MSLTEAQKKMICFLPDCGGHNKWDLDGRVLKALIAKGYASRCHRDGMGQDAFDRYCRTREGAHCPVGRRSIDVRDAACRVYRARQLLTEKLVRQRD